MAPLILITGGAGFIGQQLCGRLLSEGYNVRVLDNFHPQIHGDTCELQEQIREHVELVRADIRDRDSLAGALENVEVVVHFAAETGTGQSMYEISRYFDVNVQGTAALLDLIQNSDAGSDVRSIVAASSRALYGEGGYLCAEHGLVYPEPRTETSMSGGNFELHCDHCGKVVEPAHTRETAPCRPMSIYALTKQVQEQVILMQAGTMGCSAFALRYQNVYGPGQSLKNPYTGILAVFSNLARQGQPIDVYEDGLESRDFIYIDDAVEATVRAIRHEDVFTGALNVGTGEAVPVLTVAKKINGYFGNRSGIRLSGDYRLGDIRHNKAATGRLEAILGFTPSISFSDGLDRFLDWVATQPLESKSAYATSVSELQEHGVMKKAAEGRHDKIL